LIARAGGFRLGAAKEYPKRPSTLGCHFGPGNLLGRGREVLANQLEVLSFSATGGSWRGTKRHWRDVRGGLLPAPRSFRTPCSVRMSGTPGGSFAASSPARAINGEALWHRNYLSPSSAPFLPSVTQLKLRLQDKDPGL